MSHRLLALALIAASAFADDTWHQVVCTGQSLMAGYLSDTQLSIGQPPPSYTAATQSWAAKSVAPYWNAQATASTFEELAKPVKTGTWAFSSNSNTVDCLDGGATCNWTSTYFNYNSPMRATTQIGPRSYYSGGLSSTTQGGIYLKPGNLTTPSSYSGAYMIASSSAAETPCLAFANIITHLDPEHSYNTVQTNVAVSGQAYGLLKKGQTPFTNSITNATYAYNNRAGRPWQATAVAVVHGESDFVGGIDATAYAAMLAEWQFDYDTDLRAISGQSSGTPVILYVDQNASWAAYCSAMANMSNTCTQPVTWITTGNCAGFTAKTCPGTPIGQWKAATLYPTRIKLVGPKYQYLYNADGIHLTPWSTRHVGEMLGKAMYWDKVHGRKWVPLSPRRITLSGAVITARFHVPVGQLAFDTARDDGALHVFTSKIDGTTSAATQGFEAYVNGSAVAIASVALASRDTVTITLNATPAGGATVELAYAYTGDANFKAGTSGAARGNLRDTDPTLGLSGLHLYDYGIIFKELASGSGFTWEPYPVGNGMFPMPGMVAK